MTTDLFERLADGELDPVYVLYSTEPLLIDRAVLNCDFLLYSPGPPQLTLELPGDELPRLLAALPNAQLAYP